METQGHLNTNPGLRAHSVDPDNNLMKRYVVAHHKPGTIGWIWEISFKIENDAIRYVSGIDWPNGTTVELIDQKKDDAVVMRYFLAN